MFLSCTGYSAEAISYVSSLLQTHVIDKSDIWISHSGDQILEQVADTLDSNTLSILQVWRQVAKTAAARSPVQLLLLLLPLHITASGQQSQ